MPDRESASRLSILHAESRIRGVIMRYARSVDRRDWAGIRSCYHGDAVDDHGDFRGGVDDFIAWVRARHMTIPQSMHFIGNVLIEFGGPGVAVTEAYCLAFKDLRETEQNRIDVTAVRYLDRFEHREKQSGWLIAHRTVTYDFGGTLTPEFLPGRPGPFALSQRDVGDPLWAMRSAASIPPGYSGPPFDFAPDDARK